MIPMTSDVTINVVISSLAKQFTVLVTPGFYRCGCRDFTSSIDAHTYIGALILH